ncbi:hypothetical protein D3C73_1311390 [compost metagenome]
MGDQCSLRFREGGPDAHRNLGLHGDLYGTRMNYLGPLVRHVADFGIAHIGQRLRIFDNPRIGSENSVYICVNIDHIRPECGAECGCRSIAAASAKRREIPGFGLTLEPGYYYYFMLAQFP